MNLVELAEYYDRPVIMLVRATAQRLNRVRRCLISPKFVYSFIVLFQFFLLVAVILNSSDIGDPGSCRFCDGEAKPVFPVVWTPLEIEQVALPPVQRSEARGMLDSELSYSIDYRRCPITRPARVFYYGNAVFASKNTNPDPTVDYMAGWLDNTYITQEQSDACIFIAYLDCRTLSSMKDQADFVNVLKKLEHFGSGLNHLIVLDAISMENCLKFELPDELRSSIVKPSLSSRRRLFDINVLPVLPQPIDVLTDLDPLLPIRREIFLTILWKGKEKEDSVGETLNRMVAASSTENRTIMLTDFGPSVATDRKNALSKSTFVLMIQSQYDVAESSNGATSERDAAQRSQANLLATALRHGAVPVLIGDYSLPFAEVIDWNKAAVLWPLQRLPELQFMLSTLRDNIIFEKRRQGRLIVQNYFADVPTLMNSLVALMRFRLKLPDDPILHDADSVVYQSALRRPDTEQKITDENYIGPVEDPHPSPKYMDNFTLLLEPHSAWNGFQMGPTSLLPSDPFLQLLPTGAKFKGSSYDFRPINKGLGGSGNSFLSSLGGNYPREQFTVVMPCFKRPEMLMRAILRYDNLPFLNKIVIVWGGGVPPEHDLVWPQISVPIEVVCPPVDSLNNRFIPFKQIETDAILTVDDDIVLTQEEILFGFRTWREFRDQIVGFPGRFHSYSLYRQAWSYYTKETCELSIILTQAAFIHKFYFYEYTYHMSPLIKQKIDEFMNCEDIAMSFLVGHITRKQPIKVTTHRLFQNTETPGTISKRWDHMMERHYCINYFSRVFGYNSLLSTQVRVSSILYNPENPPEDNKCYTIV